MTICNGGHSRIVRRNPVAVEARGQNPLSTLHLYNCYNEYNAMTDDIDAEVDEKVDELIDSIDEMNAAREKVAEETDGTLLTTWAGNPLSQTWDDFMFRNEDAGVRGVITFHTSGDALHSWWESYNDASTDWVTFAKGDTTTRKGRLKMILTRLPVVGRFIEDPSEFLGEGIHEDKAHMSDDGDLDYIGLTVILPYNFMSEPLIEEYVDRINERYDLDLVLHLDDHGVVSNMP